MKPSDYNWDYLDKTAYNNRFGHYKFRREFNFILDHREINFDRVLDIGGGSGRMAIPLSHSSGEITVLDVNPAAIELLKERSQSIHSICGDFISTDVPGKFSAIICIEAIGYFADWEAFFTKVNRLLEDNGRFVFSYFNPASWRFLLRKIWHVKNDQYEYYGRKLSELQALLKKSHFDIEKIEGMSWIPLPLNSNSQLVHFFDFLEHLFRLKYWHSQSPSLLFTVRKSD